MPPPASKDKHPNSTDRFSPDIGPRGSRRSRLGREEVSEYRHLLRSALFGRRLIPLLACDAHARLKAPRMTRRRSHRVAVGRLAGCARVDHFSSSALGCGFAALALSRNAGSPVMAEDDSGTRWLILYGAQLHRESPLLESHPRGPFLHF